MTKLRIPDLAIQIAKKVLFLAVLWYVGLALYRAILEVDWTTLSLRPVWLLTGFTAVSIGTLMASMILAAIYRKLGVELSRGQAFALLTVPAMGKYLPGAVFSLLGHATLARSFGARLAECSVAVGLITTIGLAAPTLLGVALSVLSPIWGGEQNTRYFGASLTLLAILLVILHPAVYRHIIKLATKLARGPAIQVNIGVATVAAWLGAMILQTSFYLGGCAAILLGILPIEWRSFFCIIGTACLANVVGFLALFAPGGLGVREGILLMMLSPVLGTGNAAIIAVALRLLQTIVDLVSASIGYAIMRVAQSTDVATTDYPDTAKGR